MSPSAQGRGASWLLLSAALVGCGGTESTALAFTDATIWDGTGRAPYVGTLVVDEGRIVAAGPDVAPPDGVPAESLAGRFVIPGLIDVHAHVTGTWAPDDVTDPEERVRAELLLFARYGVTT